MSFHLFTETDTVLEPAGVAVVFAAPSDIVIAIGASLQRQ